ncbi:hypothetical protein SLS60_012068 [Paraconiothyrium brasiliense]|uniref:Uncharacterized protein n=1 Tax=Paraconiothyrium brasiliense TaxID=300254 RepID=A0ABR3QGS5_9PLEO
MSAQPMQSSEMKRRLREEPILKIENFGGWDSARMGFQSDQDRMKWLNDNNKWDGYTDIIDKLREPRAKFERLKAYDARRKELQEKLQKKIQEELVANSHEPVPLETELPEYQKLTSDEILKSWKRYEKGWEESSFAETHLLRRFNGLINEMPFFDATLPWDFMVLGLPSLSMWTFREMAYRQYRFAIEIITEITQPMEARFGDAKSPAIHKVYLDHTHMTPYPRPGLSDQDCFKLALLERTRHLDRNVASNIKVAPTFGIKEIMLSWLLQKLGSADAPVNLSPMILIMFKPLNPIRQLIQHLLDQVKHEHLPCVIVCAPGDIDNVMPRGNKHFEDLATHYSGDLSSDLVEDFLTRNYHKYPLLTDETLADLSIYSRAKKRQAKNMLGTLCLFLRKDLRHSPPRTNTGQ